MHRHAVRLAFAALVAASLVCALDVYVDLGARDLVEHYVYNGVFLIAAGLCAWRAIVVPRDRLAWALVAVAILCWLGGTVFWIINLDNDQVPIPSLADALYLGMYIPLSVAVIRLVRGRTRGTARMLILDGVIGVLALAAVSAALVLEHVLDAAGGDAVAMAVTIAYPVCDVVLIGIVIQAAAMSGWVVPRSWAVLAAGLFWFALADGIYYAQIAMGTYDPYGILDAVWLLGVGLMALAAWQPDARVERERTLDWRQLVAPGGFAALALGIAVYAYAAELNPYAMVLACGALLATIVRMVATFKQNLELLDDARRESVTDALTGLGNRRRLLADLDAAPERGRVLVLADLNGFKRYNDTFGHLAGDALLSRLGDRLAWAVAARGRAYRMGGDEFCVLLDRTITIPDALRLVGDALAEQGEGFAISAACGAVELPDEAGRASDALRLADARMYERKRGGRGSGSQGVALLLQLLEERSPAFAAHAGRVAELAEAVAERLELPGTERDAIRTAASLHDIGKLAIPDSIVLKPGPLDSAEWAFMTRHTLVGERVLQVLPGVERVARIVRSGHERPDGCGYPDGLTAEEIPLAARIVAACDAYDAMTSDRPHRRALRADAALQELRDGAGTQFDPAVVRALEAVLAAELAPVAR